MDLHRGDPAYPASPRWSIGLRDNWSGEYAFVTFVSFRDVILRLRIAMSNLEIQITRQR